MRSCRFCGDPLPEERPRDYCLKPACYKSGFSPRVYHAVGVHKSIPQILAATDVSPELVAAGRRRT